MPPDTAGDPPWTWIDERRFDLRGTRFVSGTMPMGLAADEFLVIKPPDLTAKYLQLVQAESPRRIVELGVKEGGSTAMLALLAQPDLLLAVDLAPDVPPLLTRFIHDHHLEGRVVPAFGLSQDDRIGLSKAIDAGGPHQPLDLVIDDASHILGPTRSSFEVLFPRLRPGGLLVIEDWSSECTVARNLARIIPSDTDMSKRLDAVTRVFHILNTPGGQLPQAVVESMMDPGPGLDLAKVDPAPATDLFEMLVEAAARADLGDLSDSSMGAVRPVADLAVELTMIAATVPDVIAELRFDSHWLTVRRGGADLPVDDFRLDQHWTDFFGYLPR